MKLRSCLIENYGMLTNREYKFEDGLTEFCEANGSGKTTLASFIKAMFYGLPSIKPGSTDFNDRKRYLPFGGGNFGGSITFIMNGHDYRITRYFDETSALGDTCAVYRDDAPTDEFGDEVGKSIFGIDLRAFERTVSIGSVVGDICATDSISEKLRGGAESVIHDESFKTAEDILERAKDRYKAVPGGVIDAVNRECIKLTGEVKELNAVSAKVDEMYDDLCKARGRANALGDQEKKYREKKLLLEKWAIYEGYEAEAQKYREELAELNEEYPFGMPDSDEIETLKARVENYIRLNGWGGGVGIDADKMEKYQLRGDQFANGMPTEEEINTARAQIDEYDGLKAKMAVTKNDDPCPESVQAKFDNNMPLDSVVDDISKKAEECREVEGFLRRTEKIAKRGRKPKKTRKAKIRSALFAAFAAIAAAMGVAFYADSPVFCLVLISIGGTVLLVEGILLIRAIRLAAVMPRIARKRVEHENYEKFIRRFLERYDYPDSAGVLAAFDEFMYDLKLYKRFSEWNVVYTELKTRFDYLVETLNAFFTQYGEPIDDYRASLIQLQADLAEFMTLADEFNHVQYTQMGIGMDVAGVVDSIREILERHGIRMKDNFAEQIYAIERASKKLAHCRLELAIAEQKAAEFKKDNELTTKPEVAGYDEESVSREYARAVEKMEKLGHELPVAEAELEKLDDKKARLVAAREELEVKKKKLKLLTATETMLRNADVRLQYRYIDPVKDRYGHYTEMVERTLGDRVLMDRDFRISYESDGEMRDDRHLSAGQRAVCSLCYRLSLMDNIFEGEQPFVLLDDPFVELDARKFDGVAKLVNTISKEKQIIYFTCHDSRSIRRKFRRL